MSKWWCLLGNACKVKAGMVFLQVKLCDSYLGTLKVFDD